MKNFFGEFKKFITRGNVIDMSVGVIVGGAFTGIVNGLGNNILKPLINYVLFLILGKDSLSNIYTVLHPVEKLAEDGSILYDEAGKIVLDMTQTIYIDWGAFINAILNFLIIAFVLFCIVKAINSFRENSKELAERLNAKKITPTKEERLEMKKLGIKRRDKAAVAAYYEEKARAEAEAKAAAEAAAAEAARLEREANPTTEDLLKQIRDLLQSRS